ncbi:MAG: MazG-like family protein [Clostridiales bacterium]|nr:MazG-like family protein [Clostridiales bacterium]
MRADFDFDVVRNISAIERLKCGLLRDISLLFEATLPHADSAGDEKEILADALLNIYQLADKMNISYERLDEAAAKAIKIHDKKLFSRLTREGD